MARSWLRWASAFAPAAKRTRKAAQSAQPPTASYPPTIPHDPDPDADGGRPVSGYSGTWTHPICALRQSWAFASRSRRERPRVALRAGGSNPHRDVQSVAGALRGVAVSYPVGMPEH